MNILVALNWKMPFLLKKGLIFGFKPLVFGGLYTPRPEKQKKRATWGEFAVCFDLGGVGVY